jgi:hypothetical protein
MDFYGTKTKLYLEASFIIMCGKESVENNLKYAYYELAVPSHGLRLVSTVGPCAQRKVASGRPFANEWCKAPRALRVLSTPKQATEPRAK